MRKFKAFDIMMNKLKEFEDLGISFTVNIIADMGKDGKHETSMQKHTSADVKAGFKKALEFNPDAVIIREFRGKRIARGQEPENETVIQIKNTAVSSTDAPQQHIQQPTMTEYYGTPYESHGKGLGQIGDEVLSVDAMVERIRNLQEKLSEEKTKRLLLEEKLSIQPEPEEKEDTGLGSVVGKLLSNEQNVQLLGNIISMFSGNQQPMQHQLAGTEPQNNVQSSVTATDDNSPRANAIAQINEYLNRLDDKQLDKVFNIFYYISQSEQHLSDLEALAKP